MLNKEVNYYLVTFIKDGKRQEVKMKTGDTIKNSKGVSLVIGVTPNEEFPNNIKIEEIPKISVKSLKLSLFNKK